MKDLENIISALKRPFSFLSKNDEDINKQLNHLKELIEEKNLSSEDKTYLLITAIKKHSNEEIIKYLIEIGANVNVFTEDGDPLLMLAVKDENLSLVKLLLKNGADVNAVNKDGVSILLIALIISDADIIVYLLQNNVNIDREIDFTIDTWEENKLSLLKNLTEKKILSDKEKTDFLFMANDIKIIGYLIEIGANINGCTETGETLLMVAISNKNLPLVKLLLEKGIDIDAKTDYGHTALMYTTDIGSKDFLDLLLKNGADVNTQDTEGDTALMHSIRGKENKIARLLIENGSDVNATNKDGVSVLFYALANAYIKISLYLLQNNNIDVNKKYDDLSILHLLLYLVINAKKKKEKKKFEKVINKLTKEGIIDQLIQHGVDIDAKTTDGYTALMWASALGLKDFVDVLLRNSADVNAQNAEGDTALILSLQNKDNKIARMLIENDADVNAQESNGITALFMATIENNLEIVDLLLQYNADPNIIMDDTWTVLMAASELGLIDIVNTLIENNATIDLESRDGLTALGQAIVHQQNDIVKQLILNGANINKRDDGMPPLMYAAITNNTQAIKLLIENGADINARKISKKTKNPFLSFYISFLDNRGSLVFAIKENNVEAVQVLLKYGAKINDSAINSAVENNNIDILRLLIEYGVNMHKIIRSVYRSKINKNTLQLLLDNNIDIDLDLFAFAVKDTDMAKLLIENAEEIFLPSFYTIAQDANNSEVLSLLEEKNIETGDANAMVKMVINREKILSKIPLVVYHIQKSFIKKDNSIEGHKNLLKSISSMGFVPDISKQIKNNSDIVFLEMLIHKQENIDKTDKDGMTALMWACKLNKIEVLKLLLKYNVDDNIISNEGKTALQYAVGKPEITSMLRGYHRLRLSHNPKELVKILTNFTKDTPIKYTTHNWDFGKISKTEHKNFQGFINAIRIEWNKFEDDLYELSPNLHTKIYTFLLNDNKEADSWCEKADISIGWSSLEGLEKWCDDGKDPYKFKLNTPYIVDNKEISTFEDVINLFKQEIENRKEHHMLKKCFIDIKKSLDEHFTITFENFREENFYTDIEYFKLSISNMFSEIKKRKDYSQIKISAINDSEGKYIDILIVQVGSVAQQSSDGMLKEATSGHFIGIKKLLTNLCDWSIESSFNEEYYRINYLRSDKDMPEIEFLDYKPDGFTYKLRFYKA